MEANNEAEIVTQLMEFATETKYTDIPKEVVEFAKGLTLKTVAGMVVGSASPSGRKMARLIRDRKLPEDVGVIGCGFKTSLWEATFLYAFFAHAAELEDNRITAFGVPSGGSSWDITVIPVVFSLAEKLRLSGKALVEALVVGLEVHARTCLFSAGHLGLDFILGAVGPAVAAARALGLGVKETTSALGLAMSNVPLLHLNFGTDAHFFESSLHSLQGIIAAEMAKEGMTGNPAMIKYLCDLLGKEKVTPDKIVKDLGRKWLFCETWIKKYPVCFLTHRHIDTLIELREKHNLSYEEVETIEAEVGPAEEICDRPEPKTDMDLPFSFQNILGAAMLDGDVNLNHIAEEAVDAPRLKEARSKVKLIHHADWPHTLNAAMTEVPARLIIKMKDGSEFSGERWHIIGSQEEPLTMGQLQELYSKFTRGILPEEQIRRTGEAILNLEKLSDMEEFMDMLVFRHKV